MVYFVGLSTWVLLHFSLDARAPRSPDEAWTGAAVQPATSSLGSPAARAGACCAPKTRLPARGPAGIGRVLLLLTSCPMRASPSCQSPARGWARQRQQEPTRVASKCAQEGAQPAASPNYHSSVRNQAASSASSCSTQPGLTQVLEPSGYHWTWRYRLSACTPTTCPYQPPILTKSRSWNTCAPTGAADCAPEE